MCINIGMFEFRIDLQTNRTRQCSKKVWNKWIELVLGLVLGLLSSSDLVL